MTLYFDRELEKLKSRLLHLGSEVEQSVASAVHAFLEFDIKLAKAIIQKDKLIDKEEVEIEEDALKMLALYHPVAMDLRFITSVLKINNDLERVGDLAVNISRKALYISQGDRPRLQDFDYRLMAEKSQLMLRHSLEAFISKDAKLAHEICKRDEEINELKKTYKKSILQKMKSHCDLSDILIRHHALTRHLERIADMATNIAEEVIYMVEGHIARHEFEDDYMEDHTD